MQWPTRTHYTIYSYEHNVLEEPYKSCTDVVKGALVEYRHHYPRKKQWQKRGILNDASGTIAMPFFNDEELFDKLACFYLS
jgi:hypothetical protein